MRRRDEPLREWADRTQSVSSFLIDDVYVDLVCHNAVVLQDDTACTKWYGAQTLLEISADPVGAQEKSQ